MPSQRVTASTTAQQVAAAIRNARYKITSLTIDNKAGGGDRQITIQDIFTPAVTNGEASPVETTVDRLVLDVEMGDVMVLSEEDLKGIMCLGLLGVIAEAATGTDPACIITVGHEPD